MRTQQELYKFHCANFRSVSIGVERVGILVKRSIVNKDIKTETSLSCLYALLIGAWAECRLKKLLYEPNGFSDDSRAIVVNTSAQFDKWVKTVEFSFRKRFNVQTAELSSSSLPFSQYARYSEVLLLLSTELKPLIELRNKFAHGQWTYLLTSDEDDVSTVHMRAYSMENFQTLRTKMSLLKYLAEIVNDLVVSSSFTRDFDQHYRCIVDCKNRLARSNYTEYVSNLQQRHERGKIARRP